MKIVFFGTPAYVVPVLENLHKAFKTKLGKSPIVAVVTQRPKPTGRKQQLEYSPVDSWAHKKNVPIFFDPYELIKNRINADLGVLASFGLILDKKVIDCFPNGIINLHPSLLPKYRGASPVQAAIFMGEKETGLTFTQMNAQLDKGKLISQFKDDILPEDTTVTLRDRLFLKAAEILPPLIPAYLSGKINLKELGHYKGTFTQTIKKDDAYITPEILGATLKGRTLRRKWDIPFISNLSITPSPEMVEHFVRAMQPWPQAWTKIKIGEKGSRIKLLKSHLSDNKLVLDQVQLEGKNPVSWKQFTNAYTTEIFE